MRLNGIDRFLLAAGILVLLSGCSSYRPATQTNVGGESAYVRVLNAPQTSTVTIDGIVVGSPAELRDQKPRSPRRRAAPPAKVSGQPFLFPVRPGKHRVRVSDRGVTLVDRMIFSGSSGVNTITVPRQ